MTQLYTGRTFRKRLLLMAMMLSASFSMAQNTVQIGAGTSVPANTLYGPVYRYSSTSTTSASRCDMVFTEAEMAAAGIPNGAIITAVAFNKTNVANFTANTTTHAMLMANTTNTTLATTATWAGIQTTHTQVYSSTSFNVPSAAGWVSWSITPFVYTGKALEIATETSMAGSGGATDNFAWQYTTGTADKIVGVASLGATLNGTVTDYKYRPNIRITYTAPGPCTTPPVPGKASVSATKLCAGSPLLLSLTGNNYGTGLTITWQSAAAAAGPYADISTAGNTASYSTVAVAGVQYYRAAVTCSGNTQYSDTVSVNGTAGLAGGTYTIDASSPTNGTNYTSFADAVAALSCGITGPVVFNVTPGGPVYNEQVIIPEILGASVINTITFKGNGNTLSFASSNTNERAVLKLNGADHVIIDSLIINATGTSSSQYGFGVQLINNADSNIIRNCSINVTTSSTSSNYSGVVINASAASATTSGSTLCDGNLIIGNTVVGGYYGMTMVGGFGSLIEANRFVNNQVKDFYFYGIYAYYISNAVIEGNSISRPDRTSLSTFYGIYLGDGTVGAQVIKNRLFNPTGADNTSTAAVYGIYLSFTSGTAIAPNLVANNLVYDINGAGSIYALYEYDAPYSHFYHNTISLDNTANTSSNITRGYYESFTADGVELKNNIISVTRGGTGSNYAVYIFSGTTLASDYNNLYVASGSNYAVGYIDGTYTSLADWQAASGLDGGSVSVDPQFTQAAAGIYLPGNAAAFNNLGDAVGVTTDINGATRSDVVPDLGAYENTVNVCVTPPLPGKVSGPSSVGVNTPFSLSLKNGSSGTGQTYQWQISLDHITFTNISGATVARLTTTQMQDSAFYRCLVTCGGNMAVSDTLKVSATYIYCSAVPSSTIDTEIFGVTLNGVKNASDCTTPATGVGSVLNRYSNFQDKGVLTHVTQGASATFSVDQDDCTPSTYYSAAVAIWIDYNRDGDFNDPDEKVFVEDALTLGPRTISGKFKIPLSATAGITTMRVILAEGYSGTSLVPCLSYTYGETEDYLIQIDAAVPCAGTPVAGTTTSTKLYACPSEAFALDVSGVSTASGLTYQWQTSADNNTWTNINGKVSDHVDTSQQVTTYYRYIVTCANGGLAGVAAPVKVTSPGIVSGTYSIDNTQPASATNFTTFKDAYDYIKCGINGPVVFNVAPGSVPYNEQLIMQPVPGASAVNTITFNGNGAALTYKSTNSNERAVIKLNGADHVIFDSLIINATGSTSAEYGFGVQLLNDADSNIVRKCTINITTASTSSNYAGVVISASATSATTTGTTACDGNVFANNSITGGYYGMTLVGGSGSNIYHNRFVNNTVKDFYYYGIYILYTGHAIIEGNSISRPNRSDVSLFYGIRVGSDNIMDSVVRNRIFNTMGASKTNTSTQYGIYIASTNAKADSATVFANNLMYDFNGAGTVYAFYNSGSPNTRYYHNTLSLDNTKNTSDASTYGFYQSSTASNVEFKNNIITLSRGGTGKNYGIYLATSASVVTIDYNNYFKADSSNNYTGYSNSTDYKDLIDWQNGTSKDAHSVVFDPEYLDKSQGDYKPMSNLLDNLGTALGVSNDINQAARSVTTPDMGAYEYVAIPCTTPPVPGTVVSSVDPACLNVPFTLSINGGVTGYGQTYQWQSSADNTNWNNIATATNRSLTTTQGVSTYYRIVYTCGTNSVPSTAVRVTTPTLVSGTFTIDKTQPATPTRFQSFNDAYNFLRCGINGPVVFNVAPGTGPYNEQLVMEYVQGVSAVNTITFNGNGNTIRFASTNGSERAVIKLKGSKHVIFDSLVIDARSGDYAYGVQLTANSDSNTVRRCVINALQTSTSDQYAGIVISGSETDPVGTGIVLSDDNNFEYNKINGGYYGITLAATFTNGGNGRNRFMGNTIMDFYATGIYVAGSYGTIIDSNSISRPNRTTVTEFKGIYFTAQKNTGCYITRNRIFNPFGNATSSTDAFYGIYFNNSDGSTGGSTYNENTVSNNLIYGVNGAGAAYGIANTGSDYAYYYHNTVVLDNESTTSTATNRGFYQTTTATGLIFANNLIAISAAGTGTKHCIYLGGILPLAMDYNDYYISSIAGTNAVGYYGASQARLSDWVTAVGNGMERASVSSIPSFVDAANGNYTPGNAGLNNKGAFVGVTNDIVNVVRSASTPDIGAYEFTPPPCSVPPVNGKVLIAPASVCQNKKVYLSMDIRAYGEGQTFQWQTAKTLTGAFENMGKPMLAADTVINSDTTLYYRVVASCGTNTVYSDTVQLIVSPAMPGGTYTINKTLATDYVPGKAGGNFASFADAKTAMGCGITGGPIVFNVAANTGPYNEKLALDSIAGVTAINTITFNGNGNTITANSSTSTDRAVITLNGADHITFDNLVIDAGTGTYGYGVQLLNNADSNTFRNNTIKTSVTGTTSNFAGVVINASASAAVTTGNTLCDANLFENNTITGGNYGITVVGGTAVASYINNNRFAGNTIKDFYTQGMYVVGTANTVVEGNTFTRSARTTNPASIYGIYVTDAVSNRLVIRKNRFTRFLAATPAATATSYAIYHNSQDASVGNEDTVVNNLVYNLGGSGAQYGFYNLSADNVFYYHNTIALDDTLKVTAVTTGFYQSGVATGLRFKNNIVTVTRGGAGNKYGMYRNTTASEIEANKNDYYIKGINAYTGFYNAVNLVTVDQLKAATGQDTNSVTGNPLYTDSATGNFKPQLVYINDMGLPLNVASDIENAVRSTTKPDIGAYEFNAALCANPLVPGTAILSPASGLCLEKPVQLDITGHSPLGSITFQWEASPDGTNNWKAISQVQYSPAYDTVTTINSYYRAKVVCETATEYTNVIQIGLNNIMPAGTYTINSSAPATYVPGVAGGNFQSFNSAVQAMGCGVGGKVVINVLPGTNGVYNEQLLIPYVAGTSAANTVTFQSENGVASSANLSFAGTAAKNYTLRFDSTQNFIFKNLTITAQSTDYGRAVDVVNGAAADSIVGNTIVAPAVTTTTNATAGIYVNGNKGNKLVLKGNAISNGAYGIYFAGTSATLLSGKLHVIDSNQVVGTYVAGIYAAFANSLAITNNTVTLKGVMSSNASGISTSYADTALQVRGNQVHINQVTSASVNGIYILNTRSSMVSNTAVVAGNRVMADSNNTANIYGITVSASAGVQVVNNVSAINSGGNLVYGLYSLNNTGVVNYYNNSSNITTTGTRGYPGYFTQTASTALDVRNNIFSNKGGGKALFVNNPALFNGDYNMEYTSGTSLVEVSSGTVTTFATLAEWKNTWNWDASSISYEPAFANSSTLRPDINNPDVWAMHGRGVQIKGNNYDYDNNVRIEERALGVPDLGAYEFYPQTVPTVLSATPAVPVPNTTQVFTYGTDTVMRIAWDNAVPTGVSVRRYSGVVPQGLPAGMDSMYFYTQVEVTGSNDQKYNAQLYYVDSWQGSVADQNRIGMGRTTAANAWVVGAASTVDIRKKEISQNAMLYMDRFTGLINAYAQPVAEDSSSNRGRDFWVGYQRSNGFTGPDGGYQTMKIYMGAGDEPANVTITIEGSNGTPWVRNYYVPANSAITSDDMPTTNPNDARLFTEGLYQKQGIHIVSDVPIVAYAHVFESTNSGATLLMPTAVWGYEYYTLSSRQYYSTSGSASAFHVVAQHDNTWVEINPSKPTLNGWTKNGGTRPNGSYLVKLNKGDAYQVLGGVLSGAEGQDLTGSYVKSISNDAGECFPIGVFAGSTRTAIGCGTTTGGNGDYIIQQIFPYQAWGTKYATAPTSMQDGPSASYLMLNIYRVMVKDTATIVKRNGTPIAKTELINNKYYQFESSEGEYIESDKPVMVAQYMTSSGVCGVIGYSDPEMFYISPVQQAVKRSQFYRNDRYSIENNFITLVIPTEGLATLKIDKVNYLAYPAADRYVYTHPHLPGYSIVTKKWEAGAGSSVVESDMPFTGMVYGVGSAESYGYNIGTLVKNLNNLSTVNTSFNTGANPTDYTCKGAPFNMTILLPIAPETLTWQFSKVPKLSPAVDSVQNNPVPVDTVTVEGVTYYAYTVKQQFIIDTTGIINVPVSYTSPLIEKCSGIETGVVTLQILPAPETDFSVVFPGGVTVGCEGSEVTLTGDVITANGIALSEWQWTFPGNATATGQIQKHVFNGADSFAVTLRGVTADGCVSDTTKYVVVKPRPVPVVTKDSIPVCAGDTTTFTVDSVAADITYNWYDAATGGTLVHTGLSFTTSASTPLPATYYVEGVSAGSCASVSRKKVTVYGVNQLDKPVVSGTSTPISITFTWTAVSGATGYEVSIDGGTTWITPSSGATGTTHVIEGLTPFTEVTILVRALGVTACQLSVSDAVTEKTTTNDVFVGNAFTPNGDGINDVFIIQGYAIKEMKFMVFNQWGEKLAETVNPVMDANGAHVVWDGRYKGKLQPSGVYMYVAQILLINGETVQKKGAINLIR
ncbi:gliding motility-associated C-terminal domain-containing protein [Filimonas lacunae]|uniref:Gliding motility-associated C-terminal domain-containing protein n=1 Tax=Filimonas lacunae TaxID=477680 RepID=A0A173MBM9_9BACT|nr:right-handed parallel beta-helix repeat-containing protein [Filimonas lacunae]BAV04936.1 Muc19 precursor [Filimonas lacunae]SIT33762.1 gliding motility-associated C-terminal domain-containing protein [Filimonas lacunae]